MLIQDVGRNVQLHKCVLGSVDINNIYIYIYIYICIWNLAFSYSYWH